MKYEIELPAPTPEMLAEMPHGFDVAVGDSHGGKWYICDGRWCKAHGWQGRDYAVAVPRPAPWKFDDWLQKQAVGTLFRVHGNLCVVRMKDKVKYWFILDDVPTPPIFAADDITDVRPYVEAKP